MDPVKRVEHRADEALPPEARRNVAFAFEFGLNPLNDPDRPLNKISAANPMHIQAGLSLNNFWMLFGSLVDIKFGIRDYAWLTNSLISFATAFTCSSVKSGNIGRLKIRFT